MIGQDIKYAIFVFRKSICERTILTARAKTVKCTPKFVVHSPLQRFRSSTVKFTELERRVVNKEVDAHTITKPVNRNRWMNFLRTRQHHSRFMFIELDSCQTQVKIYAFSAESTPINIKRPVETSNEAFRFRRCHVFLRNDVAELTVVNVPVVFVARANVAVAL